MTSLFIAQLLVPVLLLVWLITLPARSALGLIAQLLGSLLIVFAIASVGLWLFPPWWVPRAVLAGVATVGLWRLLGSRWQTAVPTGALEWLAAAFFAGVAAMGTYGTVRAHLAARPPGSPQAVEMAFPLEEGRYLVVNGGGWEMLNSHRASMDTTIARLRPWRGNGYAVDIVALHALGTRAPGLLPADPRTYAIFGVPVLAPCAGDVFVGVDGAPDMPVPQQDMAHMAGNHVILDCGGVHVVLAHFQAGSVLVHAGDQVGTGQPIGRVGNSGMSSEPHLHIHAQRPGLPAAPMGGDPLPMRLGGRYLVRGDRVLADTDRREEFSGAPTPP